MRLVKKLTICSFVDNNLLAETMDPFDMPSTTKVVHCLKHWGTDSFADSFFAELAEHELDLPLQELCISGGHPSSDDFSEFSDLKIIKVTPETVNGSFEVSFTEASPTGCRDIDWNDPRHGTIVFELDLSTGRVEFENPLPRREYDNEEF